MIAARKVQRRAVWLAVGCLLFAVAAPALAEAPGAESPQALVERMKRAGESQDFGEVMACLAPEGRVEMASMMYVLATMIVGFSMMGAEMGSAMGESLAEDMSEEMGEELTAEQKAERKAEMEAQKEKALAEVAKLRDAYNLLAAKYGLPELTEEGEEPDADLDAIFEEIDQAAFIEDVMAFLESMPGDEGSPLGEGGSPWDVGEGTLTDLVIEGDSATGKIDDDEVTFVRIDGRWYFDAQMFGEPGGP